MIQVSTINFALGIFTGLRLNIWALLPVAGAEAALALLVGPRLMPISATAIAVAATCLQVGYAVAAFSSAMSRDKHEDMNACRPGSFPVKF